MVGRLALLGDPYDVGGVSRDPLVDRGEVDARGITPPPLKVDVTYTGTDPAIGAVLSGQTSKVIGTVVSVDGTANTLIAQIHGARIFSTGETLTNHTAGGTITADAVALAASSFSGLTQPILGNPRTREVGYLGPLRSPVTRRRREIRSNAAAATFDVSNWEGTVTVTSPTAASVQSRAFGPSTRVSTLGSVNSWAGVNDGLNLFRPRWWTALTVFFRVQTFTNARIWVALTNVALNPTVQVINSGSSNRMFAIRLDGGVDNDFHVMSWDGSTATDVDTNVQGASNTLYVAFIDYDDDAKKFLINVYNWTLGAWILSQTISYSAAIADLLGVVCSIECVSGSTAQHIDIPKIIMDHNS